MVSQSLETVSGPRGVPGYSGTSGGEGPSQPVLLAAPSSPPTHVPHSPLSSPVSCCSGPPLPEEVLIYWKLACLEVTQENPLPKDATGLPSPPSGDPWPVGSLAPLPAWSDGAGLGWGDCLSGPSVSCHQPAVQRVKDASDWGHCLVKGVCLGV